MVGVIDVFRPLFDFKIMVNKTIFFVVKKTGREKKTITGFQVRGNPPDSQGRKERHLGIRDRRLVTSVPLCGT